MKRLLMLEWVPKVLASVASRYVFVGLFFYLVVLPVLGLYTPSANAMLVGGNYTNVTGALGACIASAVGLTIRRDQKKRHAEQRTHESGVKAQIMALHRHVATAPQPAPPKPRSRVKKAPDVPAS